LYDKILRYDSNRPNDPNRDRFILSKGHASLGLYSILEDKGLIPPGSTENFCAFDSILGGHPDRNKVKWVEASTGSLGHGFPISVGLAFGLKIKKSLAKVFVIVGDGECNEGTIWESSMLAAHHKLNNLCCIIDYNHSTDRALQVGDLADKFRSFGWETTIINGHDQKAIENTLMQHPLKTDRPFAVIAETIKGYGVKSIENNWAWHHRSPAKEELENLLKDIY